MNTDAPLIAGMATFDARYEHARHAAYSLSPQVDRLYLYVNVQGFSPPGFDFPDNVEVLLSHEEDGDLQDAGKFWGLQHHDECFYFSCDDDLTYPATYIDDLWTHVMEREGGAACAYHGCVAPNEEVDSYYSNQEYKVHWREGQDRAQNVNILGTGVMGFYKPRVDLPLDVFGDEPMADLYAASHFQETQVPCVALPHPERWIKKVDGVETTPEISNSKRMDKVQAKYINSRKWTLHR